jgi:molybdopterin-biosynthesis enzyme MoeA-like protein
MIKQADHYAGGDAEPPSSAKSADQLISSGSIKNTVDEAPGMMKLGRTTNPAVPAMPKGIRDAETRTLEAYIERRRKLAERIRTENPTCTEEEIEARLEVFGA